MLSHDEFYFQTYPIESWTPWDRDDEIFYGIMSGELVPPV